MIVDGTNAVLGRMATSISKELKKGETVDVVNAEKIIITGSPSDTVGFYRHRRERGSRFHGPFFPKTPDGIVRRAIRGMIDYKSRNGKEQMGRLKVHVGIPQEMKDKELVSFGKKDIKCKCITIDKLSKSLGG